MTALLTFLLNFLPGLSCCDNGVTANPGSCSEMISHADVAGCTPDLDVSLAWCDGGYADPGTVCEFLAPHVGDVRCCPIGKGFVVDAADCAYPLGEAEINGVTYYGCSGYAEATVCDAWAENNGVWSCDVV